MKIAQYSTNILFLLLLAFTASAGDLNYLGKDKESWPQTEFRKTENDFGAWLIVTPDLDWEEKWDTPPDTVPSFREAKVIKRGEQIVILTFFANPKADSKNETNVICSLKVTNPDGKNTADAPNIPCSYGKLQGNPNNIRMSPAAIQFTGDENDPFGIWTVNVIVNDINRKTVLNLQTKFELVEGNG